MFGYRHDLLIYFGYLNREIQSTHYLLLTHTANFLLTQKHGYEAAGNVGNEQSA